MKKLIGLCLLLISFVYSAEYVSPVKQAYMPEEASAMDFAAAIAPATVYYDGVFHQFYCSTGGGSDNFYVHADDEKYGKRYGNESNHGFFKSWDFVRYRTSKNGSSWSGPKIVMTQTKYSSSKKQNTACDPAIIKHGDYWYLYYAGNIDNYNNSDDTYENI